MDQLDQQKTNVNIQGSINIWIILVTVVVTAVIAGGITYYWQATTLEAEKQQSNQNIQSLQQQISQLQTQISQLEQKEESVAEQPTASEDQYKDWKTYKNSANSFTFDYPANWYLGSDPGNTAILRSRPSSGGTGMGLLDQDELGIEIMQSTSNNTQEIKGWCGNNITAPTNLTAQLSNGHYTTVGGSNAYSVDFQIKEDARLNGRQICVAKGNSKFILVAYPLNSNLLSNFDKIVETFKFTK